MGVSMWIGDDLRLSCVFQLKLCNYCNIWDAGIRTKAAHPWLVSQKRAKYYGRRSIRHRLWKSGFINYIQKQIIPKLSSLKLLTKTLLDQTLGSSEPSSQWGLNLGPGELQNLGTAKLSTPLSFQKQASDCSSLLVWGVDKTCLCPWHDPALSEFLSRGAQTAQRMFCLRFTLTQHLPCLTVLIKQPPTCSV